MCGLAALLIFAVLPCGCEREKPAEAAPPKPAVNFERLSTKSHAYLRARQREAQEGAISALEARAS
jgi:hypothetical protein